MSLCIIVNRQDIIIEFLVFSISIGFYMIKIFVIGATVSKYLADDLNRIAVLIFRYEGYKFIYCFLANMAVVFLVFHSPSQVAALSFAVVGHSETHPF